jgi:hypothetical protein
MFKTMKQCFTLLALGLILFADVSLSAQGSCILVNPGKVFSKQQHKASPIVKTVYNFDVGATSGREFLIQQDLFDAKGNYKSSGMFSEDGNKKADIKYSYDAASLLTKKEVRYIGKNEKEVYVYAPPGRLHRKELRTKGDTLISYTEFSYDDKGFPTQEIDYRGDKAIQKRIFEDQRNDKGLLTQTCHYVLDSIGNKVPGSYPLTVNEYDDQGMILQTTVYNNREKRKMLNWVYYKYQLDNDYRIIKRTGYNEEQLEVSRTELSYTDSSVISVDYKSCGCATKTSEKLGSNEMVFDAFGNVMRERYFNAAGSQDKLISRKYDDFGHQTEEQVFLSSEPNKLIKTRKIYEYHLETTASAKPKK